MTELKAQPNAIRLAESMEGFDDVDARAIAAELRRQHARIAELEAPAYAVCSDVAAFNKGYAKAKFETGIVRNESLEELIIATHRAKGRYHMQLAMWFTAA